jgi:hypothetical protein
VRKGKVQTAGRQWWKKFDERMKGGVGTRRCPGRRSRCVYLCVCCAYVGVLKCLYVRMIYIHVAPHSANTVYN